MSATTVPAPGPEGYLALLRMPGVAKFVLAGFLGRLPMSMLGLGVVVLISNIRHSYSLAGAVSATLTCAGAIGAPVLGRFVDRLGQRRILLMAVPHAVALIGLCVLTLAHSALWSLFVAAALTGCSLPPVPSMLRARWTFALGSDTSATARAFAFEAIVDELVFIVGPVLVTTLGALIAPVSGVVCSGVFAIIGCLLLATRRETEPGLVRAAADERGAMRIAGVRVLVASCVLIGTAFGTIDVGMIAFASAHGGAADSGLLLAAVASGSGCSAVWYGRRSWRAPLHRRFLEGCVVLVVSTSLLTLASSVLAIVPLAFVAGTAISPVLIPVFGLVEGLTPRSILTEGFTWVSTALAFGVGTGVTVSGRVIDAIGPSSAFLICPSVVLLAGIVGFTGRGALRRARATRLPRGHQRQSGQLTEAR